MKQALEYLDYSQNKINLTMIWESHEWKRDLLKTAKKLSVRIHQKRWTERSFVLLEKEIFYAVYSIRKLIETQKLSIQVIDVSIKVEVFKSLGQPVHRFNRDKLDKLYDFKSPTTESIKLNHLCNQMIHSYIFFPSFNESDLLHGIFFCSDHARKKKLFSLEIQELIKVLENVGSDYPSSSHLFFDNKVGDYKVINNSGGNPDFEDMRNEILSARPELSTYFE